MGLGSKDNYLAEREGFEPSKAFTLPLFESGQFNHSCTSPRDASIPNWLLVHAEFRGQWLDIGL